eukprot:TRINITY_DN5528_c2_g1_i2.p1 TRINITY_DN5528_c2_g1~~TRINITY_DN5528_c2_g1_i2.p1  ORF type:complete len:131 (+),score=22.71 TRINITY_DN5528_c2_g1_i2:37-429(+)
MSGGTVDLVFSHEKGKLGLDLGCNMSISEVKEEVGKHINYRKGYFDLILEGEELNDEHALRDLALHAGCEVIVEIKRDVLKLEELGYSVPVEIGVASRFIKTDGRENSEKAGILQMMLNTNPSLISGLAN